jgi:type III pantothenate kinase
LSSNNSIQQYAVDIGNSGLRVVILPNNGSRDLPEPLRINWLLGGESVGPARSHLQTRLRYRPEDPQWSDELRKLVDQESRNHWWISSVNRPATEVLVKFLGQFAHCTWKAIEFRDLPLSVEMDFPERVGIDRLLATFAACQLVRSDRLIVIQAGSAVTVDLAENLSQIEQRARGRFLGGAILPGVPMMLRLLGKAADLLPELDAEEFVNLPPLPGKNTEAAMLAGASSCLVGGVQHVVNRYRQMVGLSTPVVVSGGDGPMLAPHLNEPILTIPHLVLRGIYQLAASAGA